ncbi:hypothetical protein N0O92_15230 [Alkalihalobacillus sp. MEB130]|uniref:hypothetical protein n=1 Tax=Alkalihalobacillus sp. MEB130 TaxID=2976704 RepID=UPI0028DE95EA|nr:hypothetical protein [Alkalihalobacillus sp. MEB130]MDT8861569.1 hypothetical protein [Alkalihalobacillus sp. MEB130]
MTLDWFDRVSAELQDDLESICEKYDQVGHMSIDKGAKHPRIEFFVETEDLDREYFCTLFFDPFNNEFYIESYDLDLDLSSRTILEDIEDIIDAVHESFHDFMNDEDYEEAYEYDYEDEDEVYLDSDEEEYEYETLDVDWETPEVTAYIDEDEDVEITYKFGVIPETGDGILQRTNRVKTSDDELIKDEFNFIFSKDEASTIIAMIASHMDSIQSLDIE